MGGEGCQMLRDATDPLLIPPSLRLALRLTPYSRFTRPILKGRFRTPPVYWDFYDITAIPR